MSVVEGDRSKSKAAFDAAYFALHDDCISLIECSFGADKEQRESHKGYIEVMGKELLKNILILGRFIRVANSIFPRTKIELDERRVNQDKAIGICFDILTKYQLVMKKLKVPDDKHVEEIKHVQREINYLKSWRTSDNKRFKDLG